MDRHAVKQTITPVVSVTGVYSQCPVTLWSVDKHLVGNATL